MLEQKVNGSGLSTLDKVTLQQPITDVYESLSGLLEGLADEAERFAT